ncbi:flagellin [Gluconacetobacter asukensis]|uniref:Flagellin n=1 Tax=Gluconacetobacter asukensis TaxID=1017181 RepID=A0A7W4IYI5_9PROT|nr:flagellin [Gluconacetobacter asukensis]MBB2171366.1 flagellin [Gluconacetobacter asukensis]
MSSAINQYGGSATSLILAASIKSMSVQQETLTWQAGNGTLASTFAGIGSTRSAAISLTPKLTQIQSWQSNITNAQADLSVTASALAQLVSQAQSMATGLLSVSGTSDTSSVAAVAEQAQSSLTALKTVLNTTSGSTYVFSGTDSNTPTIPSTEPLANSNLATTISNIVSSLDTAGATSVMEQATTAAATNDSASSNPLSVFSASLSVAPDSAQNLQRVTATNNNASTNVGVVATQSSTTSAASSTSTGSPIRDLMRDMMVASAMGGMSSSTTGFSDMAKQLYSSLQTTISQLTELESSVGSTQNSLTAQSGLLTSVQSTLEDQLSSAMDADPAVVATQMAAVKLQLETSYKLVADMKDMTLANYI